MRENQASEDRAVVEGSAAELGRLREAAASAGVSLSAFILEAALARAARELDSAYTVRISPEGMGQLRDFEAAGCSQRPPRPQAAARAYASESRRPIAPSLAHRQLALPFDEALPPALLK